MRETHENIWLEILKSIHYVGDLTTDERGVLKQKIGEECSLGLCGSGYGPIVGSYEEGNLYTSSVGIRKLGRKLCSQCT